MNRRRIVLALPLVLAVAACGTHWETSYTGLEPEATRGWGFVDFVVNVPETLTVSEANRYLPIADIVWRGEALGDRRFQVERMFREAIRNGASGLDGSEPVRIEVEVLRFHGSSELVRANLDTIGVNTIRFNLRVVSDRTGEVLAQENDIVADFPSLNGQAAIDAWAGGAGTSERDRLVAHLSATIAGWLGLGPDPRGDFSRLGY